MSDRKLPRRRFDRTAVPLESVVALKPEHPALIEGRTLFPTTVRKPDGVTPLLKSGENNAKLGDRVVKGKWRGFPLLSLSLEERKTCPRSCQQWADCYGNHMRYGHRFAHGPELIAQLAIELETLQLTYRWGFVVRLHGLGDFYSVEYVEQWRAWLAQFPALHCFGFTHWPRGTAIGDAVLALRDEQWERFAIRSSDREEPTRSANTVRRRPEGPVVSEGIVCPEQTGRTACCGTCGLCWSTDNNVAFILH